jgi:hypothetical protein
MIDGIKCDVDTDNPFLNRKWYGKYTFDPAVTPPDKRAADFVASVKNMFQCVTMAYALTEKQQRDFMILLHDDLHTGICELNQQLKENT